jgi:hypothetical protein
MQNQNDLNNDNGDSDLDQNDKLDASDLSMIGGTAVNPNQV